jgi:hypothetical protein
MHERYAPGLLALYVTAACTGEDALLQNGASRVRPKLITEGSPVCPRSPAAGTRGALQPAVREQMPDLPHSHVRARQRPNSEHAAEWPGSSARIVLVLLHDFPDPGKFPVSVFKSSDTLNPHERPFTGMLYRYPRSASGRSGCYFLASL